MCQVIQYCSEFHLPLVGLLQKERLWVREMLRYRLFQIPTTATLAAVLACYANIQHSFKLSVFSGALFLPQGSLGFPHNVAAEGMLEKRAQEEDAQREETESKLKRLVNHRRRLFDVLKASCVSLISTDAMPSRHLTFQQQTPTQRHHQQQQQWFDISFHGNIPRKCSTEIFLFSLRGSAVYSGATTEMCLDFVVKHVDQLKADNIQAHTPGLCCEAC